MLIPEKVNLTTGTGWGLGPCVGNTGSVPRFGIPNLCLHDGPNGVRFTDFVTHFPSGLATASTFNRDLMHLRGKAMGKEHRAKGVHMALGPSIGPIGLKAQGGRNWESFGSDPYLQGVAGAQTIKGIQEEGVVAVARHLVGYEQEHFRQVGEWDVNGWDELQSSLSSNIGDRTMHEVYLWPFADAVHAGVGGVLCGYNRVNNTYACENSYLLNHLLKLELGFQGFVVLDWGAQHLGVPSALAGLDMTMPGEVFDDWLGGKLLWGPLLTRAVYNRTVLQQRLNDMVARILVPFFAHKSIALPAEGEVPNFSSWTHHTFGQQYPYQHAGAIVQQNWHVDARLQFSDDVALGVAHEAVVLLKNRNKALPIAKKDGVRRLLVAGVGAAEDPAGSCRDQRCTDGVLTSGWGLAAVSNPFVVLPLEAIKDKARAQGIVVDYTGEPWELERVGDLADYADMAVVVVDADSGEGFFEVDGNYGDRRNLLLWHNGDALIAKVAEKCRKTVVVVNSVGPVDMEPWIELENVVAVLYTAPLGQFVGKAIADVLFGDVNPLGKLPFTIARKKLHYVPLVTLLADDVEPQDNFERGVYLDYRFFDKHTIKPRFEFGFGLLYTTFAVLNLVIEQLQDKLLQYLPCPAEYFPVHKTIQDDICDPEDALFPHEDFDPVPGYIYPYLYNENIRLMDEDESYDYPKGWTPDQPAEPPLNGGGMGGNPALFEVIYKITVEVENETSIPGAFVAQLYLEFPSTDVLLPPKVLRGFEKVYLEGHKSDTVCFNLRHRDLAIWDTASQQWIIQLGCYKAYIGSLSRKIELLGDIEVG